MGRYLRRRRRLAVGMLCMLLLLSAGCSAGRDRGQDPAPAQSPVAAGDPAGTEAAGKEQERQLRQAERPRFIRNGIRSVSLRRDGEEFLRISREPAAYKMDFDYWEILNPYDENATTDTEAMYEMFDALCSLAFETPAPAGTRADTGILDSGTGFTVEYVDTRDDTLAKHTDEADASVEVLLGHEDGHGGRYAAAAGYEEDIYILPEAVLEMVFEKKPFDYILKIPVLISADTLRDVEVTADGKQYVIRVDTAGDSYLFGTEKAEKEEFSALYQAISGVMLAGETEAGKQKDKSAGQGEPELEVVYHRNLEGAPDVRVAYYPYDAEFDSVEVNGTQRFLVRKEEVAGLAAQMERAFRG